MGLSPIVFSICLLIVAFLTKWILLGKVKPGIYPIWSWYYLRWWLVKQMLDTVQNSILRVFDETPLIVLWYQLLGAKIGRNVLFSKVNCSKNRCNS